MKLFDRVPATGFGRRISYPVVAIPAAGLFLMSCLLARGGFLSSADPGDVGRYHEFATAMLDGELPYRDFYMEYPPGAVPAFVVPGLLGGDDEYNLAFKLTVAVAGVALVATLAAVLWLLRADRRRTVVALAVAAVTPAALGAVVLNRYDLWPALLTVLGLLALLAARYPLGFGFLAAGCAVKLFPAVVLPVAAVHVLRTRGWPALRRAIVAFTVVFTVLVVPLAALGPGGFWFSVRTQVERQLQLESLGASLLLAGDKVGIYTARIVPGNPGSLDLSGSLPDAVGAVSTLALVAALAAVVIVYWRGEESGELLVPGFAASVAAAIAFAKVVSPQFLVWLVPLAPLVAGRVGVAAAALLAVVLVATQVEVVYEHPLRAGGWPVWVLLARNLGLVALFLLLLATVHARRRPTMVDSRARRA